MSPLGKFILEHCDEYKGKRSFGDPDTGALFFRMRDVTP